jgi:hypothetical protein
MKPHATYLAASLSLLSLLSLASTPGAEVLWDQSTLDLNGPGIANSYSPGFGGFVIHGVDDVTVTGSGWTVESITQYYSSWNFDWPGAVTTGYLHIAPKTGALPTFDPTTDVQVPMTAAFLNGDVITVTASGLSVPLAPGDYWIGITPVAPAGISGANLQWPAQPVGVDMASYDGTAWTNFYPGWDGAMTVEGMRPVSVDEASWGGIKSLYR